MASRLCSATRALYVQVARLLGQLGVGAVGGPTTAALVALYVSGLILLDARPTQVRVARALPGRCHDALNRLLRVTPLSTRALMAGLLRLARHLSRRLGTPGDLCVDDVVIEKPFAKLLPWAAWTDSFAEKRTVDGCHVVLVLMTFVVLQLLRRDPRETVGAAKARWQDEVLRDGQAPPTPLRAAPPEFRHKMTA